MGKLYVCKLNHKRNKIIKQTNSDCQQFLRQVFFIIIAIITCTVGNLFFWSPADILCLRTDKEMVSL